MNILEQFITELIEKDCDLENSEDKRELTAINVLEELENAGYVCGDLIMIPKKKFYELVSEVVD